MHQDNPHNTNTTSERPKTNLLGKVVHAILATNGSRLKQAIHMYSSSGLKVIKANLLVHKEIEQCSHLADPG
jgi:hypothetical protein